MSRKHMSLLGLGLALFFLIGGTARANEKISSATATANCSGFTLTVTADDLLNCFSYNIDFTFTLTPTSGPATMVPGMFTFTSSPSASGCTMTGMPTVSDTVIIPGSWPGGPLTGNFTLTGTDSIMPNTPGGATTPGPDITFGGSSSLQLNCAPTGGTACPATIGFWKHHAFPNSVEASGLTIGGVTYSPADLLTILTTPPKGGNAALILGKQLVGALLNLAAGAVHNPMADAAITNAESLLLANNINLVTSFVASSTTLGGQLTADASVLDNYNSADFNTCSEGSGLMTGTM